MNRPLAVEHNERILIELDSDLLLGSFCSLGHECGWHGFLLPISLCFLTVRSNCSLSWDPHHQREFLKGGSDPRSDDRNEAGLWRLNGRTNRGRSRPFHGPAGCTLQTAAPCGSRFFASGYRRQSADRSPDPIPDQTNYGNGPLIRHVFISCWRHSAEVSEEPMVSSQQLSCERARQSSSAAHCVENSPSPCCCQWRNRTSYFGPRNSLNSSLSWSSSRLSNEAVCRRSSRSRS